MIPVEIGWPSDMPPELREQLSKYVRRYRMGDCTILCGREPAMKPPFSSYLIWHLSISCIDRNPTWEEIHDARYALIPDEVTMAMLLPPKAEYVNSHEHCFHLWENGDGI